MEVSLKSEKKALLSVIIMFILLPVSIINDVVLNHRTLRTIRHLLKKLNLVLSAKEIGLFSDIS